MTEELPFSKRTSVLVDSVQRNAPATRIRPGAWPTLQRSDDMRKPTCSIEDCDRLAHARGWCSTHYYRWQKHGDPLVVRQIQGDDFARVFSYVDASGDCWEWTGKVNLYGYGSVRIGKTSNRLAHRAVWELLVGPIPDGLQIDHLCRNRACVNPDHLEPVTPRVNLMRGVTRAAENARKTHCKHGHPFDEENTYYWGNNQRMCKACNRRRDKERAERRRGRR